MRASTGRVTLERQDARQREMGFRLERLDREHASERLDRFARAADPGQALRQQFVRIEHRRIAREQWRQQIDHLGVVPVGGEPLRSPERLVVGDLVFRIRERGAGGRRAGDDVV